MSATQNSTITYNPAYLAEKNRVENVTVFMNPHCGELYWAAIEGRVIREDGALVIPEPPAEPNTSTFALYVTTKAEYGKNAGTFATYHEAEAEAKRLWFQPWSDVIATWIERKEAEPVTRHQTAYRRSNKSTRAHGLLYTPGRRFIRWNLWRSYRAHALMLALALSIIMTISVGAQPATIPEVHCTAVIDSTNMVQLDCYGPVMAEVYERLVYVTQVNAALAPIMAEWTFSLDWMEV